MGLSKAKGLELQLTGVTTGRRCNRLPYTLACLAKHTEFITGRRDVTTDDKVNLIYLILNIIFQQCKRSPCKVRTAILFFL